MEVARQEQDFHKDSVHAPVGAVICKVSIASLTHSNRRKLVKAKSHNHFYTKTAVWVGRQSYCLIAGGISKKWMGSEVFAAWEIANIFPFFRDKALALRVQIFFWHWRELCNWSQWPKIYSVRSWRPPRKETAQPLWAICSTAWLFSWEQPFLISSLNPLYRNLHQ